MLTGPVYDAGSLAATALGAALMLLLAGLIRLCGFLAVCFVGWLLADVLAAASRRSLRALRFHELAERAGLSAFARRAGLDRSLSGLAACVVCWLVRLLALVAAVGVLDLPTAAVMLQRLALWLPNLLVALVALTLGGLAASAVERGVRAAATQARITRAPGLGGLAAGAVWALTLAVALTQLGITPTLVEIAFAGVVAALALGFGLAFGLGAEDTARVVIAGWHRRARAPRPTVAQPELPPPPAALFPIARGEPLAPVRRRAVASRHRPMAPRAPVG